MKTKHLLPLAAATLMLAGCATDRGGTADEYNMNTGYGQSTNPEPTSSPTFRPDLNRQDIRNPNSLTQPQPNQPPPTPP